jgi:integrase/recombinase XerD
MPIKLSTTIGKIQAIPNPVNVELLGEFLDYMRKNGSSEHHQNNNLKVMIGFGIFLGAEKSFHDVKTKQQILAFLDTKVKTHHEDPDKKWITTWNNYLNRMKLFYRWLFNHSNDTEYEYWETPEFFKIKTKKSKRVSPHISFAVLSTISVH